MKRTTYRVEIAYDGSNFCGFAQQRDQASVEGELLRALKPYIEEVPAIAVGGRTDKGVHAVGQVISFWSRTKLETDFIFEVLSRASQYISIQSVCVVPRSFHARFSASGRRYVYFHSPTDVSVELMNRMFVCLTGSRCFSAFARNTPAGKSTVRTLWDARARECRINGEAMLRFDFAADGFLRRQIRVLVATTIREAKNNSSDDRLLVLSRSGDRRLTAPPAEAGGLYLAKILYSPR